MLKRPDRLSAKEESLLADLERRNLGTARAYRLRLRFDDFFSQQKYNDARGFLRALIMKALRSGLPEMEAAAGTIRRHWKLIVNWTSSRLSNGLLQAMKSSARGYRSVERIMLIGYLIGLKPREGFHPT